jgi:excisionase family DNA binding protein
MSASNQTLHLTSEQLQQIVAEAVAHAVSTKSQNQVSQFMTPCEVAHVLRIHEKSVRRLCNAGDIRSFRIGKYLRISPMDLKEYLDSVSKN